MNYSALPLEVIRTANHLKKMSYYRATDYNNVKYIKKSTAIVYS